MNFPLFEKFTLYDHSKITITSSSTTFNNQTKQPQTALKNMEKKDLIKQIFCNLPVKATHKSLGEIEVLGVRVKSNYSNNLMYMIIVDGEMLWVYDYEIQLHFTKKDYDKLLLMDFTPRCHEWLMKPPFDLEHSKHAIACESFSLLRNEYLQKRHETT